MSNTLCPQISRWILFASELRSTYIAVITINVICSCIAIIGNAIMVVAILRNSSIRHTPSFMLLCTLAISDLGVGAICQPLFIALRVTETLDDIELSCKIGIAYSSTVGCLVILSFLTITAISFDRFLAVHLKLKLSWCRDGEKSKSCRFTVVAGIGAIRNDVCSPYLHLLLP